MNGTHKRLPAGERVVDLLDAPIVDLVMRRDGVTRDDVLAILGDMRNRLFGGDAGRHPGPLAFRGSPTRLAA